MNQKPNSRNLYGHDRSKLKRVDIACSGIDVLHISGMTYIGTMDGFVYGFYDEGGRQVGTLLNETRLPGRHDVTFDASGLSSGTFIYRIEAGGQVETRSMMFVK